MSGKKPVDSRDPIASALERYASLPQYAQVPQDEVDALASNPCIQAPGQYRFQIGVQRAIELVSGGPLIAAAEELAGSKTADAVENVYWGLVTAAVATAAGGGGELLTPIPIVDGIGGFAVGGVLNGVVGMTLASIRRNARHRIEALYLSAEEKGYSWAEKRNRRRYALSYALETATGPLVAAIGDDPAGVGASIGRGASAKGRGNEPGYKLPARS